VIEPEPATPKKTKTTRKAKAAKAKPNPTDLTLADLCERYIKHLEQVGKSNGTIFSYSAELKLACAELGRDTKIASITPEQLQAFYDCPRVTTLRSGRPKAPASVAKSRRVIRLALCYALEQKWLDKVPLPASEASF
jgi:hypothetical protein